METRAQNTETRIALSKLQKRLEDISEKYCTLHNLYVNCTHIKGTDNHLADYLSRRPPVSTSVGACQAR